MLSTSMSKVRLPPIGFEGAGPAFRLDQQAIGCPTSAGFRKVGTTDLEAKMRVRKIA
jgi:hypothetical protein